MLKKTEKIYINSQQVHPILMRKKCTLLIQRDQKYNHFLVLIFNFLYINSFFFKSFRIKEIYVTFLKCKLPVVVDIIVDEGIT